MNTIITTLVAAFFTMLPINASQPNDHAQSTPKLTTHFYTLTIDNQKYDYAVMIPRGVHKLDPALLFLHGSGESGTDGFKQLLVGLPPAVAQDPDRWPFIIIAPQKPTVMSEWEDHEQALLAILDQAQANGYIDPDHLAITGLSQGGHGTITLAAKHPDRFKAAAPICGYVERRISTAHNRLPDNGATPQDPAVRAAAKALSNIPTQIFHGDSDSVVPVSESQSLHAALQELNADTHYTEFKDTNHGSWDQAYATNDLPDWFMKHMK